MKREICPGRLCDKLENHPLNKDDYYWVSGSKGGSLGYPGEAAIIRNIGGRINPALVETMIVLRLSPSPRGKTSDRAGVSSFCTIPILRSSVVTDTRPVWGETPGCHAIAA
jgi:hypothetical protein